MGGRILGDDFEDVPDLDLGKGSPAKDPKNDMRRPSNAPGLGGSGYSGGGVVFDDDDVLGGGGPSLELGVLPSSHVRSSGPAPAVPPAPSSAPQAAPSNRSMPAAGMPSAPPSHPSNRGMNAVHVSNAPGSVSAPPSSVRSMPVPTSASGRPAATAQVSSAPVPAPLDPAAMLADYGPAPTRVWQAPFYAYRVLTRQAALKQDLAQKRAQRSPEVPLFEAALRAHDASAVTRGIIVGIVAVVFALLIFVSPVIVRFVMLALNPVD